jgi:hypothetical protein
MSIHDWTRADSGIFHDFHQAWTVEIAHALNGGVLPTDFFAMIAAASRDPLNSVDERDRYADKANRIVVKHHLGQVVAVLEIVSPGNKHSQHALRSFVEKAAALLRQGISLLVVDVFPPSPRDPQGIHKAIWDEIQDEPFELPPDKPLTVAAYRGGEMKTAYVEPVAVGDPLPELPIFLDPETYVPAPLESTYQTTWSKCPDALKEVVE